MLPRYLRFVRAIALVSSASTAGCHDADSVPSPLASDTGAGEDASETMVSDTLADAADAADGVDALDARDARDASDGDAATTTAGGCRILIADGGGDEIGCDVGGMCSYPESDGGDADPVRCTYGIDAAAPDAEPLACGGISCGENCYCAGPAVGLCGCLHLGSLGPLPPPDAPARRFRV